MCQRPRKNSRIILRMSEFWSLYNGRTQKDDLSLPGLFVFLKSPKQRISRGSFRLCLFGFVVLPGLRPPIRFNHFQGVVNAVYYARSYQRFLLSRMASTQPYNGHASAIYGLLSSARSIATQLFFSQSLTLSRFSLNG